MASNRIKRVTKELQDMQKDASGSGVTAEMIDPHNLFDLRGCLIGPPDTPYAGGRFLVRITIPNEYPFKPPQMRFITKVWHPNISSQTGAICLDTLGPAWSPVQSIRTALMSLRMLLGEPNPKDPQDAEVAGMLMNEPERFAQKAHEWAVAFAGAPPQGARLNLAQYKSSASRPSVANVPQNYGGYHPDMIKRFVDMGFDVPRVVAAFVFFRIDTNGGRDYQMEEAFIGDITAHLLGEP